jgi:hypothetical protein
MASAVQIHHPGPGAAVASAASELVSFFRCPEQYADLAIAGGLSSNQGYFTFAGAVCYGRAAGARPAEYFGDSLPATSVSGAQAGSRACLPFDLSDVIGNLRHEKYRRPPGSLIERLTSRKAARGIYYLLRPFLSVGIRKHLQKVRLAEWNRIAFPRWPVDCTVETILESVLASALKNAGVKRVPFIWFWPEGARSCVVMTHDLEGAAGRDFCGALMDLDDSYQFKSAFQLIPETAAHSWHALADPIRARGFEVNLHDLNHDGYLFEDRAEFLARAARINRYARELDVRGFRSGAMYRQQQWYGAFEFDFDMSVPNAAHLEPQRGGCCSVMPYFIGSLLELPLTTTQDYSLFHILGDYSIAAWKRQVDEITARNGLVMFLTHPDYLAEPRALEVYEALMEYLRDVRTAQPLWTAMPGEVDRWWRERSRMTLVRDGAGWRIEGDGRDRARIAYASLEGDRLVYTFDASSPRQ